MFHRSWKLAATGVDGNVRLFGVNIFNYDWIDTGEKVFVEELSRAANIYTVVIRGKERRFAACERSYCVWCFYKYTW